MEVVFPLHAAWVWINYSLFLSSCSFFFVCFCCVVTFIHSGFWDCAPLRLHCAPPLSPSHPSSSPPFLSLCRSSLSVVYQDGFYGAADLYVSKSTSSLHAISVPPPHGFLLLFFIFIFLPLGVILHVRQAIRCTELPAIMVNPRRFRCKTSHKTIFFHVL